MFFIIFNTTFFLYVSFIRVYSIIYVSFIRVYVLYIILYLQDVQHKLGAVSKKSTPLSPVLGVKPRVKITKPAADSGLDRLDAPSHILTIKMLFRYFTRRNIPAFCSNNFNFTGIYLVLLQEVYQSLTFQQFPLIKLLHASHQQQLAIKLLPVLLLHQQTQGSSKRRTERIGEEGTERTVSFSLNFFTFLKFYKFFENSQVCDNFSINYKIQFETLSL